MSDDGDEFVKQPNSANYYVGLGFAVASSVFIGSSFIIKKKALIKLQKHGALRAGAGGFGYLKEWIWWAGLLTMGLGETANFIAYTFAPATLVTPLGALSILVSAVLSSRYLNEHLNLLGKIGCLLCILGSTVLVLHSPKETEIENMEELLLKLRAPAFLNYIFVVLIISMAIVFYFGPNYGRQNVFVYVILCSLIGSITVMSCKGLGLALRQTALGVNEMSNWLTWFLLFCVVLCVMTQMNYLNKSLDLFNTGIVTPVYYVLFTSLVILASSILFREWENMRTEDTVGTVCGFLTVILAVFLLNAFKDVDVGCRDLNDLFRPKRGAVDFGGDWNRDEESVLIQGDDVEHGFLSNPGSTAI